MSSPISPRRDSSATASPQPCHITPASTHHQQTQSYIFHHSNYTSLSLECMQNAYRYSHTPTQLLRIFVIVHLSSFLVSKSILDAYYNKPARQQPQQIHRKPAQPKFSAAVPSYQDATDALETARSRAQLQPLNHSHSLQHIVPPPPPPTSNPHADDNTMAPKQKGERTPRKAAGNAKKAEVAALECRPPQTAKRKPTSRKAMVQRRQIHRQKSRGSREESCRRSSKSRARPPTRRRGEESALEAQEAPAKRPRRRKSQRRNSTLTTSIETPQTITKNIMLLQESGGEERTHPQRQRASTTRSTPSVLPRKITTRKPSRDIPSGSFKAAYKAFEERRLPEIESESPGLRRNQRVEQARKEFERHPDNPFNQVSVGFDASREEVKEVKKKVREGVEGRLGDR